ncbi:S-layer homology domain-containing protein [bacterium]|nr:S-layer homology domain-containing protein [bacterium]
MFALLAGVSLVAQTVVPSAGVFGAAYSQELEDAYSWAYKKGITTMGNGEPTEDSLNKANMYGAITRAEMAKMLSVYAMEVLGETPDESASCTFVDIDSVKGDLHDFIIKSCQLGLMGQNMPGNKFRPYDNISRAEFGTALSRTLWGDKNNGGTPYYAKHLDALKAEGIMNQIANAESTKEIRGYVMLMLMRSEANSVDCTESAVALACLDPENEELYKECPAACREDAKSEDNTGEKVAKGDLAVSAEAAPNKKIIASGTSDLDTITFKTSEKVDINKITLERYGYSKAEQVVEVRLEDQDGNVIADAKGLTKDKVTLSLKKGYRTVDGTLEATLVVTTSGADGTM